MGAGESAGAEGDTIVRGTATRAILQGCDLALEFLERRSILRFKTKAPLPHAANKLRTPGHAPCLPSACRHLKSFGHVRADARQSSKRGKNEIESMEGIYSLGFASYPVSTRTC